MRHVIAARRTSGSRARTLVSMGLAQILAVACAIRRDPRSATSAKAIISFKMSTHARARFARKVSNGMIRQPVAKMRPAILLTATHASLTASITVTSARLVTFGTQSRRFVTKIPAKSRIVQGVTLIASSATDAALASGSTTTSVLILRAKTPTVTLATKMALPGVTSASTTSSSKTMSAITWPAIRPHMPSASISIHAWTRYANWRIARIVSRLELTVAINAKMAIPLTLPRMNATMTGVAP